MSNSSFYSNTGITSADVSSITSAKEAAATSETNAATSATEAANSATQAATSATNAASSETNVSNSAATATTSAANASTSETNASASAATATTQASNAATSATAAAGSASTAGTSATNAASSATNAATSETNAATSETNAANSATSAATSATNAGTSETNAAASASSASGYVTSATTQANNAATSATAAATSETNAASSATAASTSASGASTSASNANTSATNAASSASQAASSAAAAALAADNFDDTYLGSNASDPTTDNDGDALNAGDLHFNTTSNTLKVYNGSAWQDAAIDSSGFVQTTGDTMTGNLSMGDNNKAIFGAGSDLQIYHDSASGQSIIHENGPSVLKIRATDFRISNADNTADYLSANNGAEVSIRYNGAEKLATTSTGIDVTGTVTADGLTVAGIVEIDGSAFGNTSKQAFTRTDASWSINNETDFRIYGNTGDTTSPSTKRMALSTNGDISFYEDTGTTPKFFWDASAESLGLGITAPEAAIHIIAPANQEPMTIEALTNGYNYITHRNAAGTDVAYTGLGGGAALVSGAVTDYGIRATGNLLLGAGSNTERMRIDSSGNLLVGKTSVDTDLTGIELRANNLLSSTRVSSECLFLNRKTSDGDIAKFAKDGSTVGSIVTNAGALVVKGASTTAPVQLQTHDGNEDIEVDPDGFIKMETAGSERLRIDASGNLLVGTTLTTEIDESGTRIVVGDAGFIEHSRTSTTDTLPNVVLARGNDGEAIRFLRNDGSNREVGDIVLTTSATSYNTSSDHRLKENVVELTGATTRLKQLAPKRFNFIADADTTVDGFLAHEVQSVVPEAITGTHNEVDDDGNPVYQGIDQSKLVPLLVATIKELEARITALENA